MSFRKLPKQIKNMNHFLKEAKKIYRKPLISCYNSVTFYLLGFSLLGIILILF